MGNPPQTNTTRAEELQQQENAADDSCELLEQAYALGFGADASKLLAAADGCNSRTLLAQQHIRREIRSSNARMRDTGATAPAKITELRERCNALALELRRKSWKVEYFDQTLAGDSIFSAVVEYVEAREGATRKPRRGQPSLLTTDEARTFILALGELWTAFTGRTPRAGGGETGDGNFNHFVVAAFAAAGVKANPSSLPRITRKILA